MSSRLSFLLLLIAAQILPGCEMLHDLRKEAMASVGPAMVRYKGSAPYGETRFVTEKDLEFLLQDDQFMKDLDADVEPPDAKIDPIFSSGLPVTAGPYAGMREENAPLSAPASAPKGHFTFTAGAELAEKGGYQNFDNSPIYTRLFYLEIPVMAVYNILVSKKNVVYGGLGPYAAGGLYGYYVDPGFGSTPVIFGKNQDLTRMDYGASFEAGFLANLRWDFNLDLDLGLRNLIPGSADQAHNLSFVFKLGYRFR